MSFTIEYADSFDPKSIRAIPLAMQNGIEEAIETKLTEDPVSFGKPLRYSLKGSRRLRVGDYRVIYVIRKDRKSVV